MKFNSDRMGMAEEEPRRQFRATLPKLGLVCYGGTELEAKGKLVRMVLFLVQTTLAERGPKAVLDILANADLPSDIAEIHGKRE